MSSCVSHWFGAAFSQLDPALQQLHQHGGTLSGNISLHYAQGRIAGFIARRVAKKLGLPPQAGIHSLDVHISHTANQLIWQRCFAKQYTMTSEFTPRGHYPDGYWQETTGMLSLDLGVKIKNGGWYWQQHALRFKGLTLPHWLLPQTLAYKSIVAGQYRFSVQINLPLFGQLLRYQGDLSLVQKVT